MALRILRGEISRTPHSFSGHAVCPLRNLRQPGIAAHRGGACPGPGIRHWAASRIACVSLRALPEQIFLREAAPARRRARSCGLESLKVFEYRTSTRSHPNSRRPSRRLTSLRPYFVTSSLINSLQKRKAPTLKVGHCRGREHRLKVRRHRGDRHV